MKKIILIIVAVAVIVGGAITYRNSKDAGKTIKIGVIGPFTGALAEYGEAHKNGITLAAEESKGSGKNIEFVFEDSSYDTAKAISAFRKLTQIDKVLLVVDWGAATSYGIAPLIKDAKTPFIAISVDPDTVKPSDYVFRHNYSPDDAAQKLWEYFREKGYKNIGLVKLNILFCTKIADSLDKLKKLGETVTVVDTYQSFSDKDFRTSIAKLKANDGKYDTVGVFLAGGQIAQFYKQAYDQKLSLPTFGTDFFESYTEIKSAGGRMDGAVFVGLSSSEQFMKRYKARFGTDNQMSYAGLSYDLGKILLSQVDYSSTQTIVDSLRAIKDYKGEVGTYTYDDANGDRYLKPVLHIKEIQGDTIKNVN